MSAAAGAASAAPRILITRPEPGAAALAKKLGARGWDPVCAPLTVLRKTGEAPDAAGIAALIFTSANGVRCADLPAAARALPAFCVGPATAAAAAAAGFTPRIGPSDAAALAQVILADPPGGPLLHCRGRHGAGGLADTLAAAGISLREAVVYEMAETPPDPALPDALRAGIRAAAFYSPRAAAIFARRMAAAELQGALGGVTAAAISVGAAAPLSGLGFHEVRIAARPDGDAMDALLDALLIS